MSIGGPQGEARIIGNVEGEGMKNGELEFSVSGPKGETNMKVNIAANRIYANSKKKGSFKNLFKSKRVTIEVKDKNTGGFYKVSVKAKDLAEALGVAKKEIISYDEKGLNAFIIDKLGDLGYSVENKITPPKRQIRLKNGPVNDPAIDEKKISPRRLKLQLKANFKRNSQLPASPPPLLPLSIPEAPANLKELGLSNKDYNDISSYYKNNYKKLTEYKETTHIKGSKTKPPLPRSVVYVPSGPRKGLYILCKTKGGAKEVGIGSFNLATKMLHIDTGQEKIFRNGKKDHVPPGEIRANEEFKKIDPSGEHFATGEVVRYEGPWRERGGKRKLNQAKDHIPRAENDDKIGLIMDLIPGGELFDIIKIHPFKRTQTDKQNIGICKNIAEGLEKSHKEGLVNFDIKPENIFMSGDDNLSPKIADFGMVYKVGYEITSDRGTPGYLSPEILNADITSFIVEPKNEMWMMGCMMALTVKGFDLYFFIDQGDNPKKILNLGERQFTDTIQGLFPEYETEGSIDNAIVKCLSWNPKDRLSAAELVPILQNLYDTA